MRLLLTAVACGVLITVALTAAAFALPGEVGRVLLWQVTALSDTLAGPGPVVGQDAAGSPLHEGTPVHALAGLVGVLLGVPIYSLLSYVALSRLEKRRRPS